MKGSLRAFCAPLCQRRGWGRPEYLGRRRRIVSGFARDVKDGVAERRRLPKRTTAALLLRPSRAV